MRILTKRNIYIFLGLAISGVLIWFLFRGINFKDLLTALKGANYYWLIPNAILIVLTMYLRAYRWNFMLLPIKKVKFEHLIAATCIGFMANNVLPLRLGEFVRAYSLSSQDKAISKSASLANIFVERLVFDLVALLLIFVSILYVAPIKFDDTMEYGLYITIGVALFGIFSMLFLAHSPERAGLFLTKYLFFLPDRIKEFIKTVIVKFSDGLAFMTNFKAVMNIGAQTILIWVIMGISNYFVFLAFDFNLPLDASFVVLVVVSISILIPSSPGFVGVYHGGVVWSLLQYQGISNEAALSCAIVLHATQYTIVTLMGFYFLKKEHLSLKTLEEKATEEIDNPEL